MALSEKSSGRVRVRVILATLALGLCCSLAACGASADPSPSTTSSTPSPQATAPHEPTDGTVYLGVSTDWNRLATFEHTAAISQPAIFNQWTTADGPFEPTLALARSHQSITFMISWNLPLTQGQVTNGSKDVYIRAQAQDVARFGGPVFVRPDWEMNQAYYPEWSLPAVSPSQYIAAWQRVVNIFRSVGATNAIFVWAPNVFEGASHTQAAAWYPGDQYVDWIGLDAYPQSAPWQATLNAPDGMNSQAGFAQAHDKPLMLAEWAVTTSPTPGAPSDSDAVNLVFNWAESWPKTVKGLVYFDFVTQGQDFTLASHPQAAAAYRQRSANRSVFLTSLVP